MSNRPEFIPNSGICYGLNPEDEKFVTTDGFEHPLTGYGYRESDFPSTADLNIMTLGCSYAFGYGLNREQTWSQLVADNLCRTLGQSTANWNFGAPGGSNDLIQRQATIMLRKFKPDILLVAFTQAARREHWISYNRYYVVRPKAKPRRSWSPRRAEVQKDIERISNRGNDELRMYLSLKAVSALAQQVDCRFFFTYSTYEQEPSFHEYVDDDNYIGKVFPRFDRAGDGQHPGPLSNKALAVLTVNRILETYLPKKCNSKIAN